MLDGFTGYASPLSQTGILLETFACTGKDNEFILGITLANPTLADD
jgi:hypothetical protein